MASGRAARSGAGYSGTSLPAKLGALPGRRVAVLSAPSGFELVGSFRRLCADLDVILLFATRQRTLVHRLDALQSALRPAGGLWIAWPKRTSGMESDLSERGLRELILPTGWVDNKVCAIDQSWSGLRFVRRLSSR